MTTAFRNVTGPIWLGLLLVMPGGPICAWQEDVVVPEYEGFDVRKVLVSRESGDGQTEYSIDSAMISSIIAGLLPHAQGQPARFASDKEFQRAQKDVTQLSAILVRLTEPADCPTRHLYQSAVLHSLAHNMGLRTAAEQASRSYRRLLEREPENARYEFLYGRHLLFCDRLGEGVRHLERADALGHKSAAYSLGLAYALQGHKKNALECLNRYLRENPDSRRAHAAVVAVQQDRIQPPEQSTGGDSLWNQ